MEESWHIDIRDIQVKKRVGFGSYAEVYFSLSLSLSLSLSFCSTSLTLTFTLHFILFSLHFY
jgi:hypothetical protein